MELADLKAAFDSHSAAQQAAIEKILSDLAAVEKRADDRLDAIEMKANRRGLGGPSGPPVEIERRAIIEALGTFGQTGRIEQRSMASTPDPAGGYLMQPQLSAEIRLRVAQVSPVRQVARVIELTNADEYEEPVFTGLPEANWAGETAPRPETDGPPVGKNSIVTHDLYANPGVSQRLLDNSAYDVGLALIREIGTALGQKEGNAFIVGDGVGKPRGFTTYTTSAGDDESRAWGTLQHVVTGAATAVTADGLIDISEKLAPRFRANARWLMSRSTVASVRKLKSGDGDYLWRDQLSAAVPATLLGYPVTVADDMPSITAGAFPIAFGDFGEGYAVVDAKQMTILRDPYSNKPFVMFYTVARVGGGVLDFDAIKLMKVST